MAIAVPVSTTNWWVFLLEGIAAILVGLLLLTEPASTVVAITLFSVSTGCLSACSSSFGQSWGRPSAVLDDAQCQTVWKMASPNGATISRDQGVPYIVNFQMVDVDGKRGTHRFLPRGHNAGCSIPSQII